METRAGLALGRFVDGDRLAGVLFQHRLGVERIDLRAAAVQKDVDDLLDLGRQRSLSSR